MRKILSSLFLFLMICSSHAFAQTADIYQKAGDGYFDDKNYQAAFDSYNHAIKKAVGIKLYSLFYTTNAGKVCMVYTKQMRLYKITIAP